MNLRVLLILPTMQSDNMKTINYSEIQDIIDSTFPEYKNSSFHDVEGRDQPYVYVGDFAHFVLDDLDNKPDSVVLAERLLKFVDEVFNNPDSSIELVNLLQIEVFENLVSTKTGAVLAKKLLHNRSLTLLDQTLTGYGTKEFENEYRSK